MKNEGRQRRLREIVAHMDASQKQAMDISYISVADVGVQMFVEGFTTYCSMMGVPEPPDTIMHLILDLALRALDDLCGGLDIPIEKLGMHVSHIAPEHVAEITAEVKRRANAELRRFSQKAQD